MTKKPAGSRRPRSSQFKPASNRRPVISVSGINTGLHRLTMETDIPCVVSTDLETWKGPNFRQDLTYYEDTDNELYSLVSVAQIDERHFYLVFSGGVPTDGVLTVCSTGYHVISLLGVLGAYGQTFPIGIGAGLY